MTIPQKQSVKYSRLEFPYGPDPIGHPVYVWPVDHPSIWVTNGGVATTSRVVSYDETTGILETLNTVYSPE